MKTPHYPHKIITLLAVALFPIAACSMVSAQSADQTTNPPSVPASGACHHEHKAWKNLSQSERQQLKADMVKIHQDPQLVAARQAMKEAQTPEAKIAARTSLHQIRHDLLVKVDPSIESVLVKLKSGHQDNE